MEDIHEICNKMKKGINFARNKLMPALKEIEYISIQSEMLFDDVNENSLILHKVIKKSDKKRSVVTRNAVRSSCACIEGFAYVLKNALRMTLETTPDGTYSKKQREFITNQVSSGSGADNYKKALKCFAKKYDVNVKSMFDTQEFEQLKQVFDLRNRLMHPKSASDLNVTLDDAILLSDSIVWFINSQQEVFQQVFSDIEKQGEGLLVL
ncbi:hypothetical protein [Aliivibrio fischeri]|uniref:hypothetical protein n=1 Tax=Aliivibrio fischeri TaxID=668 RepID=UPI00080E058B|nr:hypothetical protein [Aliivibrio fischeri]OCH12309.1 hypothetical protein A6E09_18870 [Aliivibrio fischeri]